VKGLVLICIPSTASCDEDDPIVSQQDVLELLPQFMEPFRAYDGVRSHTYVNYVPVSLQEAESLSLPTIGEYAAYCLSHTLDKGRYAGGYIVVDGNGQPIRAFRRCNPEGRWDYFIDAPWPHKLITTTGKRVNACRVSDLSVHQLAKVNAYRAEIEFRVWESCFAGCPAPKPYSAFGDDTTSYMSQEAIENYYLAVEAGVIRRVKGCPVEYFGFDEQSHVERMNETLFLARDILIDGSWRSQPPDMPDRAWTQEVIDTLQSQPEDDWVAIQLYSS
jgi:hypothetical protein